MLDKVKLSLRISHNLLDSDIESTIDTARAELIRSGVYAKKANSEDALVESAIKTYCLFVYSNDDKRAQGFFESWQYQLDNLRKSSGYNTEGSDS
jgi:uncharacterized phage protein (predicted DNA packaging)